MAQTPLNKVEDRELQLTISSTLPVFQNFFFFLFFFFIFLGPHLWHMEVPSQRSNQSCHCQPTPLPAYTTATAMQDPSHVYDLQAGSWQHWILNLLSRGEGSNLHPHGNEQCSLPLSHHENSPKFPLAAQSYHLFQDPVCFFFFQAVVKHIQHKPVFFVKSKAKYLF